MDLNDTGTSAGVLDQEGSKPSESKATSTPSDQDKSADNTDDSTGKSSSKDSIPTFAGTKHKVKVNEKEEEVSYEDLVTGYQTRKASDAKFNEAAEKEKFVHSFMEAARNGDLGWIAKVAPKEKLIAFAEAKLLEQIESEEFDALSKMKWEDMSPQEQKAFMYYKDKRLKTYEEGEENKKKEDKKREDEQALLSVQETANKQVGEEIANALKEAGFQPGKTNPRLIMRIAEQMRASWNPDEKDPIKARLPASVALKRAVKGFEVDVKEYISLKDPEHIISLLPENVLEAVRKKFLGQVSNPGKREVQGSPEERSERRERHNKFKPVPMSEFFAKL